MTFIRLVDIQIVQQRPPTGEAEKPMAARSTRLDVSVIANWIEALEGSCSTGLQPTSEAWGSWF